MVSRRRLLAAAAAAPVPLLLPGCGSDPDPDVPMRDVTALTTFGITGRDSFMHVANAIGAFEQQRLNVTIEPGNAGAFNHQQLSAGNVEFATVDLTGAMTRFATGELRDFQVVCAVHQRPQLAFVGFAESGLTAQPKSLEGKTIALPAGGVSETLWPAYAALTDIDIDTVQIEPANPGELVTGLIGGRFDASALFTPGAAAVRSEAAGRTVVIIDWGEHMAELYGVGLITSVDTDPDLAARFRNGMLAGLQFAIDNPGEAGRMLADAVPDIDPDIAADELRIMAGSVRPAPPLPIGAITGSQLTQALAVLISAGMIDSVGAEAVIDEAIWWDLVPGADDQPMEDL